MILLDKHYNDAFELLMWHAYALRCLLSSFITLPHYHSLFHKSSRRSLSLSLCLSLSSRTITGTVSSEQIVLLAICRLSGGTLASGVVGVVVVVVVVVVGVCNGSQMRTSKCTCLIFGVSIGLDPG